MELEIETSMSRALITAHYIKVDDQYLHADTLNSPKLASELRFATRAVQQLNKRAQQMDREQLQAHEAASRRLIDDL